MTRLQRLLRLARLRGDKAAIAILETRMQESHDHRVRHDDWWYEDGCRIPALSDYTFGVRWSETELRAAWGDR